MQTEKGAKGFGAILLGSAGNRVTYGAAAPTVGTWKRGDIVLRQDATASQKMGWMCVTAGTPGTWKDLPSLGA